MRALAALAVLAALAAPALCAKPKSSGQWKTLDFDQLERDLEDGDDPSLLKSEDAVDLELMARRAAEMPLEAPPGVRLQNPSEPALHAKAAAGPTILITELAPAQVSGSAGGLPWDKPALTALADKWREMLHMAGIEAQVYDMGESTVVVTLQHGWRGYEVRDFLLAQPEVREVDWDGVKSTPGAPSGPGAGVGGGESGGGGGGARKAGGGKRGKRGGAGKATGGKRRRGSGEAAAGG